MVKTSLLHAAKPTRDGAKLLVQAAVKGIQEKKGKDIITLNLRKLGVGVADYFVICHGDSAPQLEAIVKSVEESVFKAVREQPGHIEGYENAEWILMDYFDVIIHVFLKEKREFYGIERLWADAEVKKLANQ